MLSNVRVGDVKDNMHFEHFARNVSIGFRTFLQYSR